MQQWLYICHPFTNTEANKYANKHWWLWEFWPREQYIKFVNWIKLSLSYQKGLRRLISCHNCIWQLSENIIVTHISQCLPCALNTWTTYAHSYYQHFYPNRLPKPLCDKTVHKIYVIHIYEALPGSVCHLIPGTDHGYLLPWILQCPPSVSRILYKKTYGADSEHSASAGFQSTQKVTYCPIANWPSLATHLMWCNFIENVWNLEIEEYSIKACFEFFEFNG